MMYRNFKFLRRQLVQGAGRWGGLTIVVFIASVHIGHAALTQGTSSTSPRPTIPHQSLSVRPSIEPVDLRNGPQHFVDDYLVAESTGLTKVIQKQKRVLDGSKPGRKQHANQPEDPVEERQLRLTKLPKDRFVAREAAGNVVGRLLTSPLYMRAGHGSRLTLNADAVRGRVRVQVRDVDGGIVPGFSFDDCAPITGDGLAQPVEWYLKKGDAMEKGTIDLVPLDDQTIRLEFEVSNAKLFGFDVERGKERPLRLGSGPHLFIDDYLIADSENLKRKTLAPERLDHPIMGKDHLREPRIFGGTMQYDEQRDKFRLWYWSRVAKDMQLRYLESSDPKRWSGQGELILSFLGDPGDILIDSDSNNSDRQRRFKLAYFAGLPMQGPHVAFSPDGMNWKIYDGNPVMRYYPVGHPRWKESVSDILDPYWDPIRRRYGMFVKLFSLDDKEFGMNSRTAAPGMGVRLTGVSESEDFVHWTQPRRVFEPDYRDEGVLEHYGGYVVARGDLLIAFMRILRDDLGQEGNGYTVLATSRDGRTWTRHRERFLDRNPAAGAHDHAFAWVKSIATKGETDYLVYVAYNLGHKTGVRQLGLAWTLRDRYVAQESEGARSGRLRTPLLTLKEGAPVGLWLNADAAGGQIKVRLLDADGQPVPGLQESEPIMNRDGLALAVHWSQTLSKLGDKPFRLEFVLHRAALFGFSFTNQGQERGR